MATLKDKYKSEIAPRLKEELGLEKIHKMASNEGAFGPTASATSTSCSAGDPGRNPSGCGSRCRRQV